MNILIGILIFLTFLNLGWLVRSILLKSKRISEVHIFRKEVLNLCFDYIMKHPLDNVFKWFLFSGPSFQEMVNSKKPLKLKEFYSREKIKKLLS